MKGLNGMAEIELNDTNFEREVLQSTQPVMVDFWAQWCAPCRMMSPIISELANENDKVKIGKLDVDSNPVTASQYGVMSIPTLIFFRDGKVVDKLVGVRSKAELQKRLDSLL